MADSSPCAWSAPSRGWRSGHWSLALRDDEFADIAFDGQLVLRSVRAVVRDHDWNTAGWEVERVDAGPDTLLVHLRSARLGADVRGVMRAEASGREFTVSFDAVSVTAFETNRTGLVVLHPPQLAGAPLRVTHPDGSTVATAFPLAISPHQPASGIAELGWRQADLDVHVAFDGDVFEMEDQRNWTDASFKTYSRPLHLPFPYSLPAGQRIFQSVRLTAAGVPASPPAPLADPAAPDRIVLAAAGPFPAVGLGASTAPDPAPTFAPVGAFVLVELDLTGPTWRAALARAATAGLPLDVRFTFDPTGPAALAEAVAALSDHVVIRVAVFEQAGQVSGAAAIATLRAALDASGLDIPVIGGSRSHFTELNRERHHLPTGLSGLTIALTPLFHAVDTEQLIESVAMQRLVAQQTVEYAADIPVHVGPVTLRPRFNNVATSPQPSAQRTDLLEGYGAEFTGQTDTRQSAAELAAWTIASAAALAVPGVASIAWFEEWGPRGIRSSGGIPMPAATAVEAIAALHGSELLHGNSPDGLVWALGAVEADGHERLLVANIGPTVRTLSVKTPRGEVTVEVPPAAWRIVNDR